MTEINPIVSNNSHNMINSNNTTISGVNINTDNQRTSLLESSRNRSSNMFWKTNKTFLFILFLISCATGPLIILLVMRTRVINNLTNVLIRKNDTLLEIKNQNNQTIKQLNDRLLENNKTIEQLTNQLKVAEEEKSRINTHLNAIFTLLFVCFCQRHI